MKKFNSPRKVAGQSNPPPQKPNKHDANLQKNSTLYFQIGLILCLLGTYGIFEMEFKTQAVTMEEIGEMDFIDEVIVKPFIVEPDVLVTQKVVKKTQKLVDKPPIVVDDDVNLIEPTVELVKPTILNTPVSMEDLEVLEKPEETIDLPFNMIDVERVPIYPGCENEKDNKGRLKCMSQKLAKLIQRKFNTHLADGLGLSGLQKIDVQFKIDKNGMISDVKTRAPSASLEKEAKRVVNKIPEMTPGMQRNQPVAVLYNLPIKFVVR